MRVGSLFSGVGGFDMGLKAAGFDVAWQVEIDPQARAVLRRHWPDASLHEDVRNVGRSNLSRVDLICGGFPCQDLSVAGRRAGLAGERSGLFHEFMRVVDELAPRWVLIENVPGLLSSNGGRDMGIVIGTLGDLGYGWTYRVLDLQHFGVPQRRRRVFIVGRAGGVCPPEVLLEPESLPGDPAQGGEAWEGAASRARHGFARAGTLGPRVSRLTTDECANGSAIVAGTLGTHTGIEAQQAWTGRLVSHTPRAEGFDASEDGTGRGTPLVADTLVSGGREMPPHGTGDGKNLIPHPFTNRGVATEGEAETLRAGSHGAIPMIAFGSKEHGADATEDLSPTLRAGPHHKSHENGGVPPAVAYPCLRGGNQYNNSDPGMEARMLVGAIPRRLTPVECERLMGWPDDWTAWGVNEDGGRVEMADGPRYRMCGNGVGKPHAEWIGRRIMEADAARRESEAA